MDRLTRRQWRAKREAAFRRRRLIAPFKPFARSHRTRVAQTWTRWCAHKKAAGASRFTAVPAYLRDGVRRAFAFKEQQRSLQETT